MRSLVLQRDREHAERATLVAQERLIRGKVRVWERACVPWEEGDATAACQRARM